MKVMIKAAFVILLIFNCGYIKAQEEVPKFSLVFNVAPIPAMGWEYGFEFGLKTMYSIRTTASVSRVSKYNYVFEGYNYMTEFVFYLNDKRKGFNFGPVFQIKNNYESDSHQLKSIYYHGFGLGAAVGYRFKLFKRIALIPNFRLITSYLSYKSKSDDPRIYPFLREHPDYDLKANFVVYLQYDL